MYWVIATSVLVASVLAGSCEQAMGKETEREAVSELASTYDVTDACFTTFLSRNWWRAADLSLSKAYEMGYPLHGAKASTKSLKDVLDSFTDLLESGYKVLSPAFEWAESPSTIFLSVKFSHRIDAPGCISIADPKVQMGDDYLLLTAFCKDPNFKYRAVLNLNLAGKVDTKESKFSLGSVGHMILSLEKKEESVWGNLLTGKKPINMHVWWEMKEIYEPDVEKLKRRLEKKEG